MKRRRLTRLQQPDAAILLEQIEQGAQRLAAWCRQFSIAVDRQFCGVIGQGDQMTVGLQLGESEIGQAALAQAQRIAGPAQAPILFGDDKAIIGLAHHFQPRLGSLADRSLVQQQAGGGFLATPDPAAQLVQLGQAEAFGMLDEHPAHRPRPRSPW